MKFSKGIGETYKNILQFYYNGEYINRPSNFLKVRSPSNIFSRIYMMIRYQLSVWLYFLKNSDKYNKDVEGKIWLFANTNNQKQSLLPVYKRLENCVFLKNNFSEVKYNTEEFHHTVYTKKGLYFWRYIYVLIYMMRYDLKTTSRFFNILLVAVGEYECAYQFIKKNKPKYIVFSNDHNIDCRAFLLAANDLCVKTVYIQHASVTEFFPPLEYDLCLLEGEVAHEKYNLAGPINGEVKYVGIGKISEQKFKRRLKIEAINRIGVCSNLFDSLNDIISFLNFIRKAYADIQITYRPHPSDKRDINKALEDNNISFSNSNSETSLDFISKHDVLIASNSNIHLEAACLGLKTIYYEYSPDELNVDIYGFSKEKLFLQASNNMDVISFINEMKTGYQIDINIAKRYNHVLDTEYENSSDALIVGYIGLFINEK